MDSEKFTEAVKWRGDRSSVTMPTYALTTAIAGSLGLGVLFGWQLFGEPHLIYLTYKAGNLAEWLAAIATLVVGIGAWKYAREGHLHRVDEIKRQRLKECDSLIARLNIMRTLACQGVGPSASLAPFEQHEPADQVELRLHMAFDIALTSVQGIVWSEADRACVDEGLNLPFWRFNRAYIWFVAETSRARSLLDADSRTPVDVFHRSLFESAKTHADTLETSAREMMRAIDDAISRTEEARSLLST